jgi:hypothetical protein
MKCAELFQIDTRPCARMRVAAEACWGSSAHAKATITMVIGEAVRACKRWCSGVQWSEMMVEVDYGGQSR